MNKTQTKTHWKKFHNPDYMGAYSFQPGERKVLTIKCAKQEMVASASGKDQCLVVYFFENEKPLICNVSNSKAISKVSGSSYVEDWVNVKIELFTTEVNAFGEQVEAVRVKSTPPVIKKKEILTKDSERWQSAVVKLSEGVLDVNTILENVTISTENLNLLVSEAEKLKAKKIKTVEIKDEVQNGSA